MVVKCSYSLGNVCRRVRHLHK